MELVTKSTVWPKLLVDRFIVQKKENTCITLATTSITVISGVWCVIKLQLTGETAAE